MGNCDIALAFRTTLLHQKQDENEPGSFNGYTVIINEEGTILAHPYPAQIGRNIKNLSDADRLKSLLKNAIAGEKKFLHLFSLEGSEVELVSGYTAIPSPISSEQKQKWVILAVTPFR